MAELIYFDVRGRAEPIRLLLAEAGREYADTRVANDTWPELKLKTTFGQLPLWLDSGIELAHTLVIMRYLGSVFGLDGDGAADRLRCEMAQAALDDIFEPFWHLLWSPDFAARRDLFVEQTRTRRLPHVERFLADSPGPYWLGQKPSYADFGTWHVLDCLRPLDRELVESHPRLLALYRELPQRPGIKEYLTSDRRPRTITFAMAAFGGTAETS